ncbi:hypothetical protein, partial [Neisseria gonorrhoeae]|uniref:hypothetical protein n=2 Tax=Neisseria gonorrhoeae TaxID=485 RepID=UPI0009E5DA5A
LLHRCIHTPHDCYQPLRMGRSYPYDCRMVGYLYPTKIFDASIVSEMPLLENVGFENPTYGC